LRKAVDLRGIAHITGGGIPGNLNRVLPKGTAAEVRRGSWEIPRIFTEIQRLGGVAPEEMDRVFNMGLGMIAVVPERDVFKALDTLRGKGVGAEQVGRIVPGTGTVTLTLT
jgi:phosphoribosylformylglycinamidine cyclo-ligase